MATKVSPKAPMKKPPAVKSPAPKAPSKKMNDKRVMVADKKSKSKMC